MLKHHGIQQHNHTAMVSGSHPDCDILKPRYMTKRRVRAEHEVVEGIRSIAPLILNLDAPTALPKGKNSGNH